MTTAPLHLRDGHLFIELDDALWLLDTGAPTSFGSSSSLSFGGRQFSVEPDYLGLTASSLSQLVHVDCTGLLGADVLNEFDLLLDAARGTVEVSEGELDHDGDTVPLEELMGIPILAARIRGTDVRMFFDTGAQVSYLQHETLADFPEAGSTADFYPGIGEFQTDTHTVDVTVGTTAFPLRCGTLPDLLAATLMMAGTEGIVGSELLRDRPVGYFPRRQLLVL